MYKKILQLMIIFALSLAIVQPAASTSQPDGEDRSADWLMEEKSQLGGSVGAIVAQGDFAFIGQGSRLVVLDISDIANPVRVGQSSTLGGLVQSVALNGDTLYASTGSELNIIDVSTPAAPAQAGSYALGGYISVVGQRLYVTNADGLHILDISNPLAPDLESTYPLSDGIRSAVSGAYAYTLDRNAGDYRMQVVDISDPGNPNKISEYTDIDTYPYVVGIIGNYALIGCYTGVEIVNISNPAEPQWGGGFGGNLVRSLVISGSYAYFAGWHDLTIVHMDNDGYLITEGQLAIMDEPNALAADGAYVFMGGSQAVLDPVQVNLAAGMAIIDVQQPTSPVLAGVYRGLLPDKLKVENERAYFINADELGVVDVADPEAPASPGTYALAEAVTDLDVSGDFAYYSTENSLHILDISDPANIQPRGYYTTTYSVGSIEVAGAYAYLAEYGYGLRVIDVSDPDNPAVAGGWEPIVTKSMRIVRISADYAYLLDETNYLYAIDISDPAHPTMAGTYNAPNTASSLDAAGSYVYYVSQMSAKLHILDASDPTAISQASEFALAPVPECVLVSADTAYVCNTHAWGGLRVIDVSDAYNPAEQQLYKTPGTQYDIQVNGNLIYVNDGENGLLILEAIYQEFVQVFLPLIQ